VKQQSGDAITLYRFVMMIPRWWLLLLMVVPVLADEGIFDQYRDLMGDDNPAIFVIDEGAEFWVQSQGPSAATLEACDLGLGASVTRGAYAQFPRYFADTDRVMDIETRLLYCMETLQGRDREVIAAKPYSLRGDFGTELEALVTWLAAESEGMTIAPEQAHPKERAMYAMGEEIFFYRAGPHDFSCATCHEQSNKRIRLQQLPNLTEHTEVAEAYGSWPAYRMSQGLVRTMGWRLQDCFRQQRWPGLTFGSEVSIALQTYMAVNAAGGVMTAPGLKR
jgi:sulfur-oxidizing protein SoxA